MITEMADRQVNGRNSDLVRSYLHPYPDVIAGVVLCVGLECLAPVYIGHIIAIPATFLSGDCSSHTMFSRSIAVTVGVMVSMSIVTPVNMPQHRIVALV